MPRTLEDLNNLMLSGDTANGARLLEDIARLAGTTDAQQQYMYQSKMLLPADARDLLTFFASQGIVIVAETKEKGFPA